MEDKIGRTFSDLIAEHPKSAFTVLVFSLATGLAVVLQGYSVKIWDIELLSGQDAPAATEETPQALPAVYTASLQPAPGSQAYSQQAAPQPVLMQNTTLPPAQLVSNTDAAAAQPATNTAPAGANKSRPAKNSNFDAFIGIHYEDVMGKTLDLFGQPTKSKNSALVYIQNGSEILSVKCNKEKRIDFIEVTGTEGRDFVKSRKTGDSRIKFIGQNISEIEKQLGKPTSVSGDRYTYRTNGFAETTFYCPKSSKYQCMKITVKWAY